jgi:hypothetical protein
LSCSEQYFRTNLDDIGCDIFRSVSRGRQITTRGIASFSRSSEIDSSHARGNDSADEMTARDGVIKICDKTVALPLTIVPSLSYRPGIPLRFFKNGVATYTSVLSQNWITHPRRLLSSVSSSSAGNVRAVDQIEKFG